MKILAVSNFFPPDVVGGYEIGCRNILCALSQHAEVHVATSRSPVHPRSAEDAPGVSVHAVFEPCSYYAPAATSQVGTFQTERAFGGYKTANLLALEDLIGSVQPDLIYLFNIMGLGPVGILELCVESGLPVVCHLMDHWDGVVAASSRNVDMRCNWARAKSRCAAIACSAATLESNSEIGVFRNHIVLPGGVRFPEGLPERRTSAGPSRFLYFGQLHRGKGVHKIIRAFQQARKAIGEGEATLTIIGKGEAPYITEIQRLAATDTSCASSIHFLPYMQRDRLMEEISAFDLSFCPLLPVEPFGYAAVESVSRGLPVVITREMPLYEFVRETQPEELTLRNADDLEGMARIMERLIRGTLNLAELRVAQFQAFREAFDEVSHVGPSLFEFLSGEIRSRPCSGNRMDAVVARASIYQRLLSLRLPDAPLPAVGAQPVSGGGRLVRLARCIENCAWSVEKSIWRKIERNGTR